MIDFRDNNIDHDTSPISCIHIYSIISLNFPTNVLLFHQKNVVAFKNRHQDNCCKYYKANATFQIFRYKIK